jgi:hypothetical protein
MLQERDIQLPITVPPSLAPWGMQRITDFDRLEIHPCKVIGFVDDHELSMPCEPEMAAFWTVFGHYPQDDSLLGLEPLENFPTLIEAQRFRDELLDTYPHLLYGAAFLRIEP